MLPSTFRSKVAAPGVMPRSPAGADLRAVQAARHAAVADAGGILLDWDGCVVVNNRILPATRELLLRHASKIVIVSNNSTHLPEQFSAFLARAGLDLPAGRILLAGAAAVSWLAHHGKGERVLLLGSPPMRSLARQAEINVVRDDASLVLLMRDTRFSYSQLTRAARTLQRGGRLVVANADRTHPGPDNQIIPETGALLAALMTCVPQAEPVMIGKPERMLFEQACTVLGIESSQAIMIGDNAETDIAGATAVGIRSIHVSPAELEEPDALVPARRPAAA